MLRLSAVLILALAVFISGSVVAKEVSVAFELPHVDTADYHNPYVAIWTESGDGPQTLLLWHLHEEEEDKWLVDIRRWWRKLGRYGETPDGVTGATHGPGTYRKTFDIAIDGPFTLLIEVVREDGGRSLLRQAMDFADGPTAFTLPADKEVGELTITVGE